MRDYFERFVFALFIFFLFFFLMARVRAGSEEQKNTAIFFLTHFVSKFVFFSVADSLWVPQQHRERGGG